jgi:Zn-dependent protease with chaperone function
MLPLSLGLIAYLVVLAAAVPPLLARARWVSGAPRLALLSWQAACLAALTAFAATAMLLSLPARGLWRGIAALARTCMHLVRATYCPASVPGFVAPVAVTLLLVVVGWAGLLGATQHWRTRRWRRSHRQRLDLLPAGADGVTVVPHAVPTVYTVPGAHARVVMTTAVAERLSAAQRAVALAHEQAHLAGRHDLAVGFTRLLERAFPGVPLFRAAREQTGRLVEIIADDRAAARHGRTALLGAITTVTPARPAPARCRAAAWLAAALLPALPLLALALPVLATSTA